MGFMEKVGATLATKYGTVTDGIYKGTQVALGNEPNKKVEFTDKFTQILFLDGTDEKGRHDIEKDIMGVSIVSESENGLSVEVLFHNNEHLTFILEWKKDDTFAKGLVKQFLGAKKVNQTEQEINENKYHPIKTFVFSVWPKLTSDSVDFLQNFYQNHSILDKNSIKMFDSLKEFHEKIKLGQ